MVKFQFNLNLKEKVSSNLLQFHLVIVWRDPDTRQFYRMEDDEDVSKLLVQIVLNHIIPEKDPVKKQFYRDVASRIAKGYGQEVVLAKKQKIDNVKDKIPKPQRVKRRGRGL